RADAGQRDELPQPARVRPPGPRSLRGVRRLAPRGGNGGPRRAHAPPRAVGASPLGEAGPPPRGAPAPPHGRRGCGRRRPRAHRVRRDARGPAPVGVPLRLTHSVRLRVAAPRRAHDGACASTGALLFLADLLRWGSACISPWLSGTRSFLARCSWG